MRERKKEIRPRRRGNRRSSGGKMVAVKPQDALAQSTLAGLYGQEKKTRKRGQKIETSLALAANDPNVLSNVGEAYEFLGDRAEALQYIEKAISKGYSD